MQSELKPCPFCGAKPHRGMTKVKHCQLHGDPYQDFRIWCPHGCAQVERSQSSAIAAWNARASDAEITRLTETLRDAEAREKALREALAFYARENSWKSCGMYMSGRPNPSSAELDAGNKARQALAGAKP